MHNDSKIIERFGPLATETTICKVVILSERDQVSIALRTELKKFKLDNDSIFISDKPIDCFEALQDSENSLVIIDWDSNIQKVTLMLESIQTEHKYEQIPIYLIASETTDRLIYTAKEFNATKIHQGELSPSEIKADLTEIFKNIKEISPLREILNAILEKKREKKWAEALDIIVQSSDEIKKSERVVMEWADTLLKLKNYEEAEAKLAEIMTDEQTNPKAIHLYGTCLIKTGDLDGATGQMLKAKNLTPFNASRLVDLGNALIHLGEFEDANDTFNEAKQLDPHNKGATKGQGRANLMLGKINEALDILKELGDPLEIASVFNSAAIISIKMGHHEDGLKLYDAALNALQGDPTVESRLYYNKGIGFMHSKKPKEAHGAFLKAVELDPEYEDAKHNLAVLEGHKKPSTKDGNNPIPSRDLPEAPEGHLEDDSPEEESIGAENSELGFGSDRDEDEVIDEEDSDEDEDDDDQKS